MIICVSEPNEFHSYNSNLTGAVLQGTAVAWQHIVTRDGEGKISINLLISKDHHAVRIDSQIPLSSTQPPVSVIGQLNGRITVEPKRNFDQQPLAVRIPSWCDDHSIVVAIKGDQIPVVVRDDYLWLNSLHSGMDIQITFP